METSNSDSANSDSSSINANGGGTARLPLQFPTLRFLQSPISSILEHYGILRVQTDYPFSESHNTVNVQNPRNSESINGVNDASGGSGNNGEVSIRIIEEQDRVRVVNNGESDEDGVELGVEESMLGADDVTENPSGNNNNNSSSNNNRESSPYQRYDIQGAARWMESILPYLLLLLVVFIWQHWLGFCVSIYMTVILFKSNDILRKQTSLKGERKMSVLLGYSALFILQIFAVYWLNLEGDLVYPLLMIPPKIIPPFWHAIFIILVNDTMVRQAAMILKLVVLMYYKNGRGHNFRRQGQMLTLVEYTLLLYRALLPTPVWYRFFLNKEYGSLFSSLTTGLYLTFKLTSIVEKVQSSISSLKALSTKEVNYGSYATLEQVNAAGDLCAICQEKMHVPILLQCKHIFCEDCVSEWFERERTCPLCRALVRPADLRSYGDGSTSLFFQLF